MARTQIRGNTQIMDATVNLAKLQDNFIAGTTWNVDTGNGATITGLALPANNNDAANKEYVDSLISTTAKGPDSWDASSTAYPTLYKGEAILEGDPFIAITDGIVDGEQYRVGDMIVAMADGGGATAANWVSIQANIDLASELVPGLIQIATQTEADTGTDDTLAITPLKLATYIADKDLEKTAGNGLTEASGTFNVVSSNVGIAVGADDITLTVGSDNGTSLEVTATGVELASTITGDRTFSGDLTATGAVVLGTSQDDATLAAIPSGNEALAIATVGYVNANASNTTVSAGNGVSVVQAGDDYEVSVVAKDGTITSDGTGVAVAIGAINGTSLELTSGVGAGVELASTITGNRTFSGGTFNVAAGANNVGIRSTAEVKLDAPSDGTVLVNQPSGGTGNELSVATTGYVDTAIAGIPQAVTAGAGMVQNGQNFDVVAANVSLTVNADSMQVNIGSDNGTSLEVTTTGIELASTITDARTFSGALTASAGFTAAGPVSLGTLSDDTVLVAGPSGNTDLAIATVKYVNDKIGVLSGDVMYNEAPTVTDGVADVTLANTPRTNTERVYLNGVRQLVGAGNDYAISGTTITFATALISGDVVVVDYIYN